MDQSVHIDISDGFVDTGLKGIDISGQGRVVLSTGGQIGIGTNNPVNEIEVHGEDTKGKGVISIMKPTLRPKTIDSLYDFDNAINIEEFIINYQAINENAIEYPITLNDIVYTDELYLYWYSSDIIQNLNITEIRINNITNDGDNTPIESIQNYTNNNDHQLWNESFYKNDNTYWFIDSQYAVDEMTTLDNAIQNPNNPEQKYFYMKINLKQKMTVNIINLFIHGTNQRRIDSNYYKIENKFDNYITHRNTIKVPTTPSTDVNFVDISLNTFNTTEFNLYWNSLHCR